MLGRPRSNYLFWARRVIAIKIGHAQVKYNFDICYWIWYQLHLYQEFHQSLIPESSITSPLSSSESSLWLWKFHFLGDALRRCKLGRIGKMMRYRTKRCSRWAMSWRKRWTYWRWLRNEKNAKKNYCSLQSKFLRRDTRFATKRIIYCFGLDSWLTKDWNFKSHISFAA